MVLTSKKLVTTYKNTRRHNTEDQDLHLRLQVCKRQLHQQNKLLLKSNKERSTDLGQEFQRK
jgi:hypothetical protein